MSNFKNAPSDTFVADSNTRFNQGPTKQPPVANDPSMVAIGRDSPFDSLPEKPKPAHSVPEEHPESQSIPQFIIYLKNSVLFTCVFILIHHSAYTLILLVYVQVVFCSYLLMAYGLEQKSNLAILCNEMFLGVYFVYGIFHHSLVNTQVWMNSLFLCFYLMGLTISVVMFTYDVVEKYKTGKINGKSLKD